MIDTALARARAEGKAEARAEGYAAGQVAMRERICGKLYEWAQVKSLGSAVLRNAAAYFRALTIQEEPK